jgi:coatomer protein complex subunit alpha (xenin)
VQLLLHRWVNLPIYHSLPSKRTPQTADNGIYELVGLPRDVGSGELRDSSTDGKRGTGNSVVFVARNRFAVLEKATQASFNQVNNHPSITLPRQNIQIRDLSNTITKTIKAPVQTNEIFYGGTASLILSSTNAVVLYDIQQQKILAELTTPPVKYVIWNADGSTVALLSKHSASKSLAVICTSLTFCCSHYYCQQDYDPEQPYSRNNQN